MLWPADLRQQRQQHNYGTIDAVIGTSITNAGTAHVKGSYVDLIASTNFEASGFFLLASGAAVSATNTSQLLDIALTSSNHIILPNFGVGYASDRTRKWFIPIRIPAGVSVRARAQGARVNGAVEIAIVLWGGHAFAGEQWLGTKAVAYGVNLTNSLGVLVAPGTPTTTKGAWTEIGTASEDHKCLIVSSQGGGSTAHSARQEHCFDIGVGVDAASAQTVINDLIMVTDGQEDCQAPFPAETSFLSAPVKSGDKMFVRVHTEGGPSPNLDYMLYGVS